MPRGIGVCRRRRGRAAAILNEDQQGTSNGSGSGPDSKDQLSKQTGPRDPLSPPQHPSEPYLLPNTGYNLFVVQTFLRVKRFFPAWYHNQLIYNLSSLYCPFNWTLMSAPAHAELRQAAIDVDKAVLQQGRILVAELKEDETLALRDIGCNSSNSNSGNMVMFEDATPGGGGGEIKTEPRDEDDEDAEQIVFPLDFPMEDLIQFQEQQQQQQQQHFIKKEVVDKPQSQE